MANPTHVVVLMFENRSFDHMLGFLPGRGDLTGAEFNLTDPADPASERVFVSDTAGPITMVDPGHGVVDTNVQLFGGQEVIDPAPMSGFVANYLKDARGDLAMARTIMACQSPATVPILSRLATDYCLCTRWFASVPGPTWPNRFYAHAATSAGLAIDDHPEPAVPTIQERLAARDYTWRVYAGDVPQCLAIESLFERFVEDLVDPFGYHHFQSLGQFFDDLESGALPSYTFLEPHYFETSLWHATDEHPPHDVRHGEALLAEVVTRLAASDYWEQSLLVVTYDEHGGFYDKLSPPIGVPNPDGKVSADPPFDFTRLGVRVPAVLVSPLIEPGTIDATVYEHASIPATLNRIFGLGPASLLTRRDAAANTFEKNLTRDTPRPDGPGKLQESLAGPRLAAVAASGVGLPRAIGLVHDEHAQSTDPLTGHQQRLLELAHRVVPHLP